jgi:hypothetical protein
MSDLYVRVSEAAPIPGRVGIGKCNVAVVGMDGVNDAKFLSGSGTRVYGDNWQLYEVSNLEGFESLYSSDPSDTPLVKWMKTYFGELDRQADAARVFFYRYGGEGAGDYTLSQALPAGGVKEWRTAYSPVLGITAISVHYAAGAGGIEETVAQDPASFVLEEDDTGLYTGKITFLAGYPRNSDNELQDVTPADSVLISYTTIALAEALGTLNALDIQLLCFAYDPGKMKAVHGGVLYSGVSLVDDFKIGLVHCNSRTNAGRARQFIGPLPANARMIDDSSDYGGTSTWGALRADDIGQQQNFMCISERQNVGTSGYLGQRDSAAMVAAAIRKRKVRQTLTGFTPTSAVITYENEADMYAFKTAQIMTWVKISHLRAEPFLNFGYTFGVGRRKNENNVRCIYQIKHALMTALLQTVLGPDLIYDIGGIRRIKAVISGTVAQCQMNGWCDGLVSITVPIEQYIKIPIGSRSPEEKEIVSAAQDSAIVDNIEVVVLIGPNPETIVISTLSDV